MSMTSEARSYRWSVIRRKIRVKFKLVKQIGKKIQEATGEKLATFYLFQRISMAIQRGNAACVTTCVKERSGLEGLFNFQIHEAEEL